MPLVEGARKRHHKLASEKARKASISFTDEDLAHVLPTLLEHINILRHLYKLMFGEPVLLCQNGSISDNPLKNKV